MLEGPYRKRRKRRLRKINWGLVVVLLGAGYFTIHLILFLLRQKGML